MPNKGKNLSGNLLRIRIDILGAVQGVGFRPFIYNLANELNIKGWVINTGRGVTIEAEAAKNILFEFVKRVDSDKPAIASIHSLKYTFLDVIGFDRFEIRESDSTAEKRTLIMPDIATCPDCLEDIYDKNNRRYLYPFTNCTNCGPRYSIIESLPYDRKNTSMKKFKMCPDCQKEYKDPNNRRFHAQPNACSVCGPHLEFWDKEGNIIAQREDALPKAAGAIKEGKIVAIKGLGGFHLCVDAGNEKAIKKLRERKYREEKPFALMFSNIESIEANCEVSTLEEQLLFSPEAPIVLLKKEVNSKISSSIAPENPYYGALLPFTPLHHLLMSLLQTPIVATSANLSDETICFDEYQALRRLKGITDMFLVHNRPIIRHVDDSIVRMVAERPLILRRARGYAPLPINLKEEIKTTLAVGAHLKNTVSLSVKDNVFISQHIGDLETKQSFDTFLQTVKDLPKLYEAKIEKVVCDLHPDYFSSKEAKKINKNPYMVQHHHAHIVSCMAENNLDEEVLGVAFDGTGLGLDNTIWGGEFLVCTLSEFRRVGTLRQFALPGGEIAIKEPRRSAMGVLAEIYKESIFNLDEIPAVKAFTNYELKVVWQMIKKDINSPKTSSAGRLFDAVAAIIGLNEMIRFEGQAAVNLEYVIRNESTNECYSYEIKQNKDGLYIIDWEKIILAVIKDFKKKEKIEKIAIRFHNALAQIIVEVAKKVKLKKVVLSGGCFQNKYLTEEAIRRLEDSGFKPYWHQNVPPNDGGISLGQAVIAAKTK